MSPRPTSKTHHPRFKTMNLLNELEFLWGIVPAPGGEGGPCIDECEHPACERGRWVAAQLCYSCRTPIGYENPAYMVPASAAEKKDNPDAGPHVWHWECSKLPMHIVLKGRDKP